MLGFGYELFTRRRSGVRLLRAKTRRFRKKSVKSNNGEKLLSKMKLTVARHVEKTAPNSVSV